MLDLAEEIESYKGYLDTSERTALAALVRRFDQLRREFIYSKLRTSDFPSVSWLHVAADLDRIRATTAYSPAAVDRVWHALKVHFPKQAGMHPLLRFVIRWALPVGSFLLLIVVHSVELRPLWSGSLPDWAAIQDFLK